MAGGWHRGNGHNRCGCATHDVHQKEILPGQLKVEMQVKDPRKRKTRWQGKAHDGGDDGAAPRDRG